MRTYIMRNTILCQNNTSISQRSTEPLFLQHFSHVRPMSYLLRAKWPTNRRRSRCRLSNIPL